MEIMRISNRAEDFVWGRHGRAGGSAIVSRPVRPPAIPQHRHSHKHNPRCFIGGPTVSEATGYELESTDRVEIFADDPSKIFVVSCDSDAEVFWYGI